MNLKISEIVGVHKEIEKLENELFVPGLSSVPSELLSPDILELLLHTHRPHVKKYKKGYVCVGNVRVYRVAKENLEPGTVVPVILQIKKTSVEKIVQLYLAELYLSPVVWQLSRNDIRILHKSWAEYSATIPHIIPKATKQGDFLKSFRISRNALVKK